MLKHITPYPPCLGYLSYIDTVLPLNVKAHYTLSTMLRYSVIPLNAEAHYTLSTMLRYLSYIDTVLPLNVKAHYTLSTMLRYLSYIDTNVKAHYTLSTTLRYSVIPLNVEAHSLVVSLQLIEARASIQVLLYIVEL